MPAQKDWTSSAWLPDIGPNAVARWRGAKAVSAVERRWVSPKSLTGVSKLYGRPKLRPVCLDPFSRDRSSDRTELTDRALRFVEVEASRVPEWEGRSGALENAGARLVLVNRVSWIWARGWTRALRFFWICVPGGSPASKEIPG